MRIRKKVYSKQDSMCDRGLDRGMCVYVGGEENEGEKKNVLFHFMLLYMYNSCVY